MVTAAVRWKDEFNENAKVHAFWNVFSELCHNEIVGYTLKRGEWYVFLLRDEKDNRQLAAQMDRTRDIIKAKGVEVMEINLKGVSTLVKLFTDPFGRLVELLPCAWEWNGSISGGRHRAS